MLHVTGDRRAAPRRNRTTDTHHSLIRRALHSRYCLTFPMSSVDLRGKIHFGDKSHPWTHPPPDHVVYRQPLTFLLGIGRNYVRGNLSGSNSAPGNCSLCKVQGSRFSTRKPTVVALLYGSPSNSAQRQYRNSLFTDQPDLVGLSSPPLLTPADKLMLLKQAVKIIPFEIKADTIRSYIFLKVSKRRRSSDRHVSRAYNAGLRLFLPSVHCMQCAAKAPSIKDVRL